jgi:salicylate hydroxylase
MQSITRATAFNPFAYSDRGVRDAEISAHAAFRRRLYDHDVMPEAQAAAAALG